MEKNTALFTFRRHKLSQKGIFPDKTILFDQLRERDVVPVIGFGAEEAFRNGQVEVNYLEADESARPLGMLALEHTGVVVNRMTRAFDMPALPETWRDGMPPLINQNSLIALAREKQAVYDEVLEPLGLGIVSRLVTAEADAREFVDEYPAEKYVVKPNSGMGGKSVRTVARGDVVREASESDKPSLVQKYVDVTVPWPASIRPYDERSREKFEAYRSRDVAKEIRFYGFHGPESTAVFPVGRARLDGRDEWFFIDPDSLDRSVAESARQTFELASRVSGSTSVFGALDIAYARDGDGREGYHVVELNGRAPYFVGFDKHPQVATHVRALFADMVRETIEKGGKP